MKNSFEDAFSRTAIALCLTGVIGTSLTWPAWFKKAAVVNERLRVERARLMSRVIKLEQVLDNAPLSESAKRASK